MTLRARLTKLEQARPSGGLDRLQPPPALVARLAFALTDETRTHSLIEIFARHDLTQ